MNKISATLLFIGLLFLSTLSLGFFFPSAGHGWPMWRHDKGRTAVTKQKLADELHLQWTRQYPPLQHAWEDIVNQDRMGYDRMYEPIVLGKTMFVGSNRSDKVVAIDTITGKEKWAFYTDGPVRFAPVGWKGKVYFVSDDGFLYCVKAQNGKLLWKFRGGADDRKILGNSRVVSAWPARGGPVIEDGIIYFGASIWPFMGVFIHAVDAKTGNVVWTNDGVGPTYTNHPHGGSVAFGSIAPHGAFAIVN
ncbi:MAG: PQQ-like beta-propeller repeat protein, partial [Planctomycetes bacterium]|nr:PQQ-like beta-propeller repeat protein [Planctomycetota bacterium]